MLSRTMIITGGAARNRHLVAALDALSLSRYPSSKTTVVGPKGSNLLSGRCCSRMVTTTPAWTTVLTPRSLRTTSLMRASPDGSCRGGVVFPVSPLIDAAMQFCAPRGPSSQPSLVLNGNVRSSSCSGFAGSRLLHHHSDVASKRTCSSLHGLVGSNEGSSRSDLWRWWPTGGTARNASEATVDGSDRVSVVSAAMAATALWHMSSTLKKRRAKMNKHKLRKRRKLERRKAK